MMKSRSLVLIASLLLAVFILSIQACRDDSPPEDLPASYVRVVIDESDPERLLSYYFGGYVVPQPADPFDAGMVAEINRRFYINLDTLELHFPGAISYLTDANGDNRIDEEELESFVDATYNRARQFPRTLDTLVRQADFGPDADRWLHVDIDGVMTTARRRVHIQDAAIRAALDAYHVNDERILYPKGTTIIGEHYIDARRVETTVMRKRADGFWDFAVYGANDSLAQKTTTTPKELESPVQCVGCHFGSKLFEPEKSFPARARPGPHGPRELYVDETLRDTPVVRYFDEHRKRSDTILGLYTTLFVADLRRQQRRGIISERDAALLDRHPIR